MFEIIFSGFWMLVLVFMTFVSLRDGDFSTIIFLIPFWAAGVWLLLAGIKKLVVNAKTNINGTLSYGVIVDFSETGAYINDYPVWNAHVKAITEHGLVREFKEVVGTKPTVDIGDIVSIKWYQDDINIIERVSRYEIPEKTFNVLKASAPVVAQRKDFSQLKTKNRDFIVDGEYIIVDGVRYKRPT